MDKKPLNSKKDREYYSLAFKILGDFGIVIAVPVILFSKIGLYFDEKYNIYPWLTVCGFVFASIFTGIMVNKKAKIYAKKYEDIEKK